MIAVEAKAEEQRAKDKAEERKDELTAQTSLIGGKDR